MSASRENVRYFKNYCWFAREVTAAMLVVCWWSEQKHFSPLGTIPYFHVNSSRKNSIVLTTNTPPTKPPCHVVANQENAKVICSVSSNERRPRKERKKSKKELVYEQNNLFARASRFLMHSLTSRHDSWCDVLWGTLICDDEFSFLFFNLDKVLKDSTPRESAYIKQIKGVQIDAIKFRTTQIHFITFSDVFIVVAVSFLTLITGCS